MPVRVNWWYAGEDCFGEGFLRGERTWIDTMSGLSCAECLLRLERTNRTFVRTNNSISTSTTLDLRGMRRVIFQSPDTLDGPIIIRHEHEVSVLACQRTHKLAKPHRPQECSFQPSEVYQKGERKQSRRARRKRGKRLTSVNFALAASAM
jgi:hypothetical protein